MRRRIHRGVGEVRRIIPYGTPYVNTLRPGVYLNCDILILSINGLDISRTFIEAYEYDDIMKQP